MRIKLDEGLTARGVQCRSANRWRDTRVSAVVRCGAERETREVTLVRR